MTTHTTPLKTPHTLKTQQASAHAAEASSAATGGHRAGVARRVACAGITVVAAVTLAACGDSSSSSSTQASSVAVSSTPATSSAAVPSTSSTIEPTTTTTAAVPKCTSSDLSLSMGSPNGAAGSIYYDLILTNSSDHPCTMYGYPGVSAVKSDRTQVGPAAERNGEAEGSVFELEPGSSATAALELVQAGAYSPEKCGPADAAGFLVYPPDDTGSLYVDLPSVICTNQANTIVIGPMHKQ